ncbi:MAG: GDP-mannose 4,6-dehydratase [Tetrasphaera sp.]|nr:GDP-mannose 4,6-dehydratase [Tetrasphaera sp.]
MPVALVTGVAGQDGGYLAERLLADGYAVHGLTRSGDDPIGLPAEVVLHRGDLTDRPAVSALVAQIAPDEVYNLGGQSSVSASWKDPDGTFAVNATAVEGLVGDCLELQQRSGRSVRLVQASSAEIFGEPAYCPQDEDTPIAPVSPYGRSKAAAHTAVLRARSAGLHASSLILYNHESPRRPTTFVTRKITSGVAAIAHHGGGELVLGNLAARRDWGWAPDYVEAMVRSARHTRGDTYVIATGVAHSVSDFVAAAFARIGITNWAAHVRVDPDLFVAVDPSEQRGCADHAANTLGWRPSVPFAEIVGRMVDADLQALAGEPR